MIKNCEKNIEQDVLSSIINSSYDGLTYTDENGIITFTNKAYYDITGLPEELLYGKSIYDLALKKYPISEMVVEVFNTKETLSEVIKYVNSDKEVLVTIVPVYDDNGGFKGIIGNIRDLTSLNGLRKELSLINAKYSEEKQKQEKVNKELQLQKEKNIKLTEKLNQLINSFDDLEYAGNSIQARRLAELAYRISHVDSTTLITGESGVGKDVFCRMVHKFSDKTKPIIKISCGAIPENLMESELFGYEPGAFTGAGKNGKKGIFELAQDGMIFLDEVGELTLPLQVKLLTVLQDRKFFRIGGTKEIKMNARIISATNRNLKDDIEKGKFRSDLYYRLNVIPVYMPPLRERKEDIILLANKYLQKLNNKNNTNVKISFELQKILVEYDWPGNIRELNNLIERMYVFNTDDMITVDNLPDELKIRAEDKKDLLYLNKHNNLKEAMEFFEAKLITKNMDENLTLQEISDKLGISISTLERKLEKYDLNRRYNKSVKNNKL